MLVRAFMSIMTLAPHNSEVNTLVVPTFTDVESGGARRLSSLLKVLGLVSQRCYLSGLVQVLVSGRRLVAVVPSLGLLCCWLGLSHDWRALLAFSVQGSGMTGILQCVHRFFLWKNCSTLSRPPDILLDIHAGHFSII